MPPPTATPAATTTYYNVQFSLNWPAFLECLAASPKWQPSRNNCMFSQDRCPLFPLHPYQKYPSISPMLNSCPVLIISGSTSWLLREGCCIPDTNSPVPLSHLLWLVRWMGD